MARLLPPILAVLIAVGTFFVLLRFHAPGLGTPGVDENAYLTSGKLIAHRGSAQLTPASPFAFVGPMWVKSSNGRYVPKYPVGVPLLDALAITLAGGHDNLAATLVSPACASAAVLGMYFLAAAIVEPFLALIATLLLAANSTLMQLALVPSSHAPAIAFAVWGMAALLAWRRNGNAWLGTIAGVLIGGTIAMRYTEGLLVLPMALVLLFDLHQRGWRRWPAWRHVLVPAAAWLVPVVMLVIYNRIATGHWTGYDNTHESTGFSWANFDDKWASTLSALNDTGLFFLLPLALLGLLIMSRRMGQTSAMLALWIVPPLALYTAYYWGGGMMNGVGYLRFFLTIYPPLIIAAAWCLQMAATGEALAIVGKPARFAGPIVIGLFTLAAGGMSVYAAGPAMLRNFAANLRESFLADAFLKAVPAARHKAGTPEPIFFADGGGGMSSPIMFLQFIGDGDWFSADAFTPAGAQEGLMGGGRGGPGGGNRFGFGGGGLNGRQFGGGFGGPPMMGGGPFGGPGGPGGFDPAANTDPNNAPTLIDPARLAERRELYAGLSQATLTHDESTFLHDALNAARPVYAVLSSATSGTFSRRIAGEGFDVRRLSSWTVPAIQMGDDGPPGMGGRGGRGGFGGGGRRGNGNGRPGGFGLGGLTAEAQDYVVLQVQARPTAPPTTHGH